MNVLRSKMSASFYLGELAGVPWITLPLAEIDGAPLGVSLISACGTDAWRWSSQNLWYKTDKLKKAGFGKPRSAMLV